MSTRGRVKQLEKIHSDIAGGGSCFTARALKKYLGSEISTDTLPSSIYFSDFLDAFQAELTKLQDQEEYLNYQISQYKLKKSLHQAKYDEEITSLGYSSNLPKITYLNLTVDEARELPAMNTNNTADPFFSAKCDNEVIFQSPMICDTADPVWNSRFSVPVTGPNHLIEIEVWDDEANPEFIGSFAIDLKTYEDQEIHCRWYDLEGPEEISNGEVKVTGQWIYNLANFHQNLVEKYENLVGLSERTLELVSGQISKLYSLSGKELLQAWFNPPLMSVQNKPRRTKNFLSVPPSKNNSVIDSPRMSPRSRYIKPDAFYNLLASKSFDKLRYDSPLGYSISKPSGYSINYFALGMFYSRFKNKDKK